MAILASTIVSNVVKLADLTNSIPVFITIFVYNILSSTGRS
ncbi:hypothetical protein HMPREF9373_1861 [Psychrobacter sp. 1501(2011)]|nr:hypothetical protein HMPREF9373_1861 [Psychrobacter sp. 1501(2011)]